MVWPLKWYGDQMKKSFTNQGATVSGFIRARIAPSPTMIGTPNAVTGYWLTVSFER